MKPTTRLAECDTPGGKRMVLLEHDGDIRILVDGHVLMNSRQHESELELARLGCAHLTRRRSVSVLVGGLGLGYTLRQCLDLLGPDAAVTVCELMPEVIEWNREFLGGLTDHPLLDRRVQVAQEDMIAFVSRHKGTFDAILLDIDNGPNAMTEFANRRLYGWEGICACCSALKPKGCMAIWSAAPDKAYERALLRARLAVRRYRVPAYKGSRTQGRYIWVAARETFLLPPGGGEPIVPVKKRPAKKGGRRQRPGRRR